MHSAIDDHVDPKEEQKDIRKKSRVAAILAILFWFLILGYPLFSYTFPLPEKPGILMSFGDLDGGGELAVNDSQESTKDNESNPEKSSAPQKVEDAEASKKETTAKSVEAQIEQATDELSFLETNKEKNKTPEKVANPEDKKDLEKVEAEKKATSEAAQKAKREEDARLKKEAEEAKTKEFGNLFSGEGSGTKDSKQGDPDGEPDRKKLDGLSTGKGNIGEGLADRGVLYEPTISENSQKIGRIVVRVCVNSKGEVIESKYTQKGSTSTDFTLIQVAEKGAKLYKFTASGLEKQCGVISIDFKLK